jgi:hypothetical protein
MRIPLAISVLAMSTNPALAGGLSAPASTLSPIAMKRNAASTSRDYNSQLCSFDEENEGELTQFDAFL